MFTKDDLRSGDVLVYEKGTVILISFKNTLSMIGKDFWSSIRHHNVNLDNWNCDDFGSLVSVYRPQSNMSIAKMLFGEDFTGEKVWQRYPKTKVLRINGAKMELDAESYADLKKQIYDLDD